MTTLVLSRMYSLHSITKDIGVHSLPQSLHTLKDFWICTCIAQNIFGTVHIFEHINYNTIHKIFQRFAFRAKHTGKVRTCCDWRKNESNPSQHVFVNSSLTKNNCTDQKSTMINSNLIWQRLSGWGEGGSAADTCRWRPRRAATSGSGWVLGASSSLEGCQVRG